MTEKLFKFVFRFYRRRLERKISFDRWDVKLSAKLDAITILLDE